MGKYGGAVFAVPPDPRLVRRRMIILTARASAAATPFKISTTHTAPHELSPYVEQCSVHS